MKMKDVVRLAVVKTNPHWPFSKLNKAPYHAAIQLFLQQIKNFPEVQSAYLRHGFLEDGWIPGISDIDFTLITESRLNVEREFLLLRSFWTRFDRIKKFFPMLGEVDVLNQDQSELWTKVSIRGYEAKKWELIYGAQTLRKNYIATTTTLLFDSIDHALLCYLNLFHRRLYRRDQNLQLKRHEMARLCSKILRYVHYLDRTEMQNGISCGSNLTEADMVFAILTNLEKTLQAVPPDVQVPEAFATGGTLPAVADWKTAARPSGDFDASTGIPTQDRTDGGTPEKDETIQLQELEAIQETVESIILSHNWDVVILRDLTGPEQLHNVIHAIYRVFARRNTMPVIVTGRIFEYIVRFYDPFLYTHLLRCGNIAYGSDPMSAISPPDLSCFIRCLFKQITNVLTFPQSYALINSFASLSSACGVLDSMLEHSLFIKLFLEKRFISPWHYELLSASQQFYPEYYQTLLDLKNKIGFRSEGTVALELFRFWKDIAQDIHASLTMDSPVENLSKTDLIMGR